MPCLQKQRHKGKHERDEDSKEHGTRNDWHFKVIAKWDWKFRVGNEQ